MAIEFTNKPIKWTNEGTAPSEDLKTNGFQAGYKPPAAVFNNQWHTTGECIDELQTKLSDTDDKKVDKADGKSLIDENVANNIEYYKDNSGYPHIGINPAGMECCVFSYDGLKITEITHPSHSVILSTTEGLTIQGEMDVSLRKGPSGGTLHKLSEKANSSDVLTKTNATEFAPTGDYNPATKKYVDDKVGSITVPIIDNLESDSTTSALSAKQGKVLDTALAAKVDEAEMKNAFNNFLLGFVNGTLGWINLPLIDDIDMRHKGIKPGGAARPVPSKGGLNFKTGIYLSGNDRFLILENGDIGTGNGDVAATVNDELHLLSEKANIADVLAKTNTTAFTPTGNYQPATKKYIDDTVANLPIKSLESKTLSTFYNETAIAQTGATIIGDCSERTFSTVGTEHFVKTGNIATGLYAVAAGAGTTATGDYSTAFGRVNVASGHASFAAGQDTEASGYYSTIFGKNSTALAYQFKIGSYAKDGTPGAMNSTVGDAFIIGNGVDEYGSTGVVRSNAFRVTYAGKAYGLASYSSSGADYAEYFEWKDGNPDNEDRRGRLVTLDGEKIRLATADDDYILGVVSANPCIEGDVYSDDWQGKYLTDVFGQRLTQTVHIPARYEEQEVTDPETGETTTENVLIEEEHDAVQWVLNPDYDPEQEYISREDRKEWTSIGLMGKLVVIDDGTCEVNGYCKAGVNGIATKADDGYRVMARIDDTHIRVLVR